MIRKSVERLPAPVLLTSLIIWGTTQKPVQPFDLSEIIETEATRHAVSSKEMYYHISKRMRTIARKLVHQGRQSIHQCTDVWQIRHSTPMSF